VRGAIDEPLVSNTEFIKDARHDIGDGEVLKDSITAAEREEPQARHDPDGVRAEPGRLRVRLLDGLTQAGISSAAAVVHER
jgi:hypothetical protein